MTTFGETSYAVLQKKHNESIKELRNCGLEELLNLPKIVVIGSQSVGKSSLIEAISQIKVPRAASTCTRCPMEVILTRAVEENHWHCTVSLRIDWAEAPKQQLGVYHFRDTDDRDEVPKILCRAQLAILNPSKDLTTFSNLPSNEAKECLLEINFSQNTVIVEISGADVDVTFIDLPGLISNTERVQQSHL